MLGPYPVVGSRGSEFQLIRPSSFLLLLAVSWDAFVNICARAAWSTCISACIVWAFLALHGERVALVFLSCISSLPVWDCPYSEFSLHDIVTVTNKLAHTGSRWKTQVKREYVLTWSVYMCFPRWHIFFAFAIDGVDFSSNCCFIPTGLVDFISLSITRCQTKVSSSLMSYFSAT